MISGELRRFLRDHGAVRVSRSVRDTAYRVLQVKERLTAELGREPDVEVIAKELGIKRSEVVFALDSICDPVSLYEPVYSDSGESVCVMDQIGDTKTPMSTGSSRSRLMRRSDAFPSAKGAYFHCDSTSDGHKQRSRARSE